MPPNSQAPYVVLMKAHVAGLDPQGDAYQELYTRFRHQVDRASRRYPDAYFELGVRNEVSLLSLAHQILVDCEFRVVGRLPFRGRTPFVAYIEENTSDGLIRTWTFWHPYALLREQLKKEYMHNLRERPEWRWQADLWAATGRVLARKGRQLNERVRRQPYWAMDTLDGSVPPSVADCTTLDEIVSRVVYDAGGKLTQVGIVQAIKPQAARFLPFDTPAPAGRPPEDPVLRLSVHRAVTTAWRSLDDATRRAVAALMRGAEAEEVLTALPDLGSQSGMTRMAERVDRAVLESLARELGHDAPSFEETGLAQRELLELIYAVLLKIVEEAYVRTWRELDPAAVRLGGAPRVPTHPIRPEDWAQASDLWEALSDAALAQERGLGGSLLAGVGALALELDPARALAQAEYDERLWVDTEET